MGCPDQTNLQDTNSGANALVMQIQGMEKKEVPLGLWGRVPAWATHLRWLSCGCPSLGKIIPLLCLISKNDP